MVQVLGNLRSKTLALENTQDLVTSDRAHLGHTVAVTELSTDLRRSNTLTSELNDLLDDLLWRSLEPGRRVAAVRESRLADTLTVRCRSASLLTEPLTVHATHDVCQVKRNVSALHAPNFRYERADRPALRQRYPYVQDVLVWGGAQSFGHSRSQKTNLLTCAQKST